MIGRNFSPCGQERWLYHQEGNTRNRRKQASDKRERPISCSRTRSGNGAVQGNTFATRQPKRRKTYAEDWMGESEHHT